MLLLRGMLRGLFGFAAFCAVVALLIVPAGITTAFVAAAVAALGVQVAALTSDAGGGRPRGTLAPVIRDLSMRHAAGLDETGD